MLKKRKEPNDVYGFRNRCPSYSGCPLCYGCRSYDSANLQCLECAKNKKNNICNKSLHKDNLINQLISKTKIKIKKGEE